MVEAEAVVNIAMMERMGATLGESYPSAPPPPSGTSIAGQSDGRCPCT
jgi:hypothetical protein